MRKKANKLKLHWLGHVPFEDAANIEVWARKRGHMLTSTHLYADEPLPNVNMINALFIMGGPMNIYQHRRYPWLIKEKKFIERIINAKIPLLGICLGAQLIADVLGAKITKNPHIEIGWFPVRIKQDAKNLPLWSNQPVEFNAFHWHGDTFEIPHGAVHLAGSDACENQAFIFKNTVIGLQFHLEYSTNSIHKMLTHCCNELIDAPFVQNKNDIISGLKNVEPSTELLFMLLDNWLGKEF